VFGPDFQDILIFLIFTKLETSLRHWGWTSYHPNLQNSRK